MSTLPYWRIFFLPSDPAKIAWYQLLDEFF
jgi:hypothetical protein